MNSIKISNLPLIKSIEIDGSKSVSNRLLILCARSNETKIIKNISHSTDTTNLIKVLKKIGITIFENEVGLEIRGRFPNCEVKSKEVVELEVFDGGTTFRFLLPLLSLGTNTYKVKFTKRLGERPIAPLLNCLSKMSVVILKSDTNILITGPLKIDPQIKIDCEETTQFYTALRLSLNDLTQIIPLNIEASSDYILMTDKIIKNFSNKEIEVPIDFSSLGYILGHLNILNSKITINSFKSIDETQGDRVFIKLLEKLGFEILYSHNGLEANYRELYSGFELDCKDCLDLVPVLAYFASYATSNSRLMNLKNLKLKESDRLKEILNCLDEFNVNYQYDDEKTLLEISGNTKNVEFKTIHPPHDHRIIMMYYLFLRKNSGGELFNINDVSKSFPNFFEKVL